MVEIREARYFRAVAEHLSFSRAAETLQISQPPLSAAIKLLERRLKVQLLHRTTRDVQLTAAGAVFLEHCQRLIATAEAADIAARQAADGEVGTLRIAAVTSAFTDPLPQALLTFTRDHPGIDVRVREIDSHIGVELVQRHEIDIAVVRQLSTPRGCKRRTLKSEVFVLAAPAPWDLPSDLANDLALAADLPWIWIPRDRTPDYHDQVAASCRAAEFAPQAQHIAQSIDSQLAMVAAGLGVALVPESYLREDKSATIRVVRFRHSTSIDLAAIWRDEINPVVSSLLATFAE